MRRHFTANTPSIFKDHGLILTNTPSIFKDHGLIPFILLSHVDKDGNAGPGLGALKGWNGRKHKGSRGRGVKD
jgi:hypothetical protein